MGCAASTTLEKNNSTLQLVVKPFLGTKRTIRRIDKVRGHTRERSHTRLCLESLMYKYIDQYGKDLWRTTKVSGSSYGTPRDKMGYNEHSVRGGAAVPAACHGNFLQRLQMFVKFKWVGCARKPRWKSPQTPPTTSTYAKQIFNNYKLPLNCSRKQSRPSLTADIRRVVQQSWCRLVDHRSLDQLGIPVFLEIFHLTPAAKKLFHYSEKVRLFSLSYQLSGTHCKAHLFVDCRLNFEDIKRLILVVLLNLFYSFLFVCGD